MTASPALSVRPGQSLSNPATGERGVVRIAPSDANGRLLVADLFVRPGGAVSGEHVHPHIEEAFTVLSGRVALRLNGVERVAAIGERIVVPAGTVHDWWNAGDEEAHVVVEVKPGDRFLLMIANLFGLAQDGLTDAKGMPRPLRLAVFAREFEDVMTFTNVPRAADFALKRVLAPIGHALGYRGNDPKYAARLASAAPEGTVALA